MPHLVDLYQRLHPRGLEIVAVAMYYDVPSHVVALRDAQKLPYPIVLDLQSQYARAFGHVQLTPTTFLIAPDGRVAEQIIGVFDPVALQQHIETYL
jgi:peroxiredoxin